MAINYFGGVEEDLFKFAFLYGAKDTIIGEKYGYFYTTDVSCASELGLTTPGIVLSRPFDDSPRTFSGSSYSELKEFGQ